MKERRFAMLFSRISFVCSLFSFFLWVSPSFAMTVTPMQIEMTSTGRTSKGVITVVNDGDRALPVELLVKKAVIAEDGAAVTSPAGDEFLVMPPQALIPPGATQNFRIQWLGEPMLDKSESFFIYVNQIPVKLSRQANSVQVVFSMGVMVNVAPPQGKAELDVVASNIIVDKRGRRRLAITVENPANVHALLPQSSIRVSGGGWSETIAGGELAQQIGIGLVQPGRRRRFVLPITVPPSVTNVQCSLEFPKH